MARNAYIATQSSTPINSKAEAKIHLRVDFTDDDTYIDSLCLAATQTINNYCNLLLMDTDVVQFCDKWEESKELYFSPTLNSGDAAITKIEYYDSTNSFVVWGGANYEFDAYSAPLRIELADGVSYPAITERQNAIKITYAVGASAASTIPDQLKQAGLILIGNMYENRQEIIVGRSVGTIPMTARYLMNPYKIQTLGKC